MSRFAYVKYDEETAQRQAEFKKEFESLEKQVEGVLSNGRAKSLVLTKLEEAYMWVGKALRDDCIFRNPEIVDVPERTNA